MDKEYWEFTRSRGSGSPGKAPMMDTGAKLLQVRIKLGKTNLPWQRTLEDFRNYNPISPDSHKRSVQNAINYGYPVPAEVLAEYPDLKQVSD